MPIDAYDASIEYDETRYTSGVTPKVDGSVELTLDNFIPEENLRELSADGAPPEWDAVRGATFEGWVPYITAEDAGGARGTLQAQLPGGSPLPPETDTYPFATPIISGGQAPTRTTPGAVITADMKDPDDTSRVIALEKPVVTTVAATTVGFPPGVYGAAISLVGRGGSHTRTTEEGPVVTVSSNGKRIEFKLLTDADRDLVKGQGLWLTEPALTEAEVDWNTLRLQDVAPNRGRTYTLNGPYKWNGRLAPNKNETAIDKPEPFRYRRDYRLKGRLGKDLQPGEYLFYRVESTRVGDSLPSRHGPERQVNSEKKEHGYVFKPKKLHPEAVGFKIFVQDKTDGLNPPFYQLMRVRRGDKARYFNLEEEPTFFGIKDAEMAVTDTGEEKDKSPERSRYVLVAADPPTEDASGLEDPSGEIDAPLAVGTGSPGAGTYRVGYTKRFSGEGISISGGETPVSELETVVLPDNGNGAGGTDYVIQMQFPPRVNKIPNALYGQLDQAGLPVSWKILGGTTGTEITTTSTVTNFEQAGVLYLQTSGLLINTGRYPNATQPVTALQPGLSLVQVDTTRIETIAGFLEVSSLAFGRGYVEIVQYNDVGTEVHTPLNLATLSQNGKMWVQKTVGGIGSGADVEFGADTSYAAIRWGAENNPSAATTDRRQLRVKWHSQVWAPFDGVPRRFEPEGSPLEHSVASNDPAAPYPATHVLKIGLPPGTASDVATIEPPLAMVSYDALADGDEPAGWTPTYTNAGSGYLGAYTGTGSTTFGDVKTYRVKSDNTGAKSNVYIQETFSPSGDSLAVLFRIYFEQMPTRNPSSVRIAGIRSASANMAQLRVNRTGGGTTANTLSLVTIDKDDKEYVTTIASGLKATDYIEVEVLISGGGTTSGSASTTYGVNSTVRGAGPGRSGVDFTGRMPVDVRMGGHEESHSDTKWTFQFGEVVVTETGYAAVENNQPALTVIPQTDRPFKDGTTLAGPATGTLDYDAGAASRSNLAVAGSFLRSGTPGADTVLMEIVNTTNTAAAARLYAKTTNTVEVRNNAGTVLAQVNTATDTSVTWRYELVVEGAGTTAGMILVYRTSSAAGSSRDLVVQLTGQDLSSVQAQRARVPGSASYTETNLIASEHGEYVPDDTAPLSSDEEVTDEGVYQEYVSVLDSDVISDQENIGFDVEEFFVKPGIQRTAAVYMRAEDLPEDGAPFTIVEYDDDGVGTELDSVYADGTAEATPGGNGWYEYWLTYTPTQKRVRWEHRGMTSGRYVAQKRLDAVGNLTTRAARDAMRDGGCATSGVFTAVLNARVPSQSGTQFEGMWLEERVRLGIVAQTPTGTSVTGRYRSATSEAGLTSATWETDPDDAFDLEWVEVEATLNGDGALSPTVPEGGISLYYKCFQPVLLRDDRSALPGGVYIGGGSENNLPRPYRRSMFDVEAVGDRAAPRAITARIGRLGGFPVSIFTPEALDELQSDDILAKDWYVESPYHDLVMRVRFYEEPTEAVSLVEYPLLDEGRLFWSPVSMEFERAEMVESGPLE
jgi:hypothetical protein